MNTGRIYKSKLNKGFTVIPNEFLQNPNFSAKAKGLLCYILSLPEDWKIYKMELINHFKDGRDSLMSGWKELVEAGYIRSIDVRNEEGHFKGYDYEVFTEPITNLSRTDNPKSENPITENPISDNPQLQKKQYTKETVKQNKYKRDFDENSEPLMKDYKITQEPNNNNKAQYLAKKIFDAFKGYYKENDYLNYQTVKEWITPIKQMLYNPDGTNQITPEKIEAVLENNFKHKDEEYNIQVFTTKDIKDKYPKLVQEYKRKNK